MFKMSSEVSLTPHYSKKLASGVPLLIKPMLEVGSIGKFEQLEARLGSTSKAQACLGLKKFETGSISSLLFTDRKSARVATDQQT